MKKVIVIVGPTASGKTDLSIRLAQAIHGEIINGDSVQVYRGLDIGSAKIKAHERQNIPHHLFDIRDVKDPYTVYDFQQDARRLIDRIDTPIIVGGTGFYVKAALYDYDFSESGRSARFDLEHNGIPTEVLVGALADLDPKLKIDTKNRRRVLRALEQAQNGSPRSEKTNKDVCLYEVLTLYLDIDRTVLEARLIERLDRQIDEGFIGEVQWLRDQGHHLDMIGYREIDRMLEGEISLLEAKEEIVAVTKRLAKKQKTWFKNQMSVVMLDALSNTLRDDALSVAKAFLKEGRTS